MAEDHGISIIVPTCNRVTRLAVLLDSLAALQPPPVAYDIFIVDNGSTDDTAALIRRFAARSRVPVHYLYEPQHGPSSARNAGARGSSAAIVAFTDDDQDVAPNWLVVIERTLRETPDVDVIGGRVLPRWLDTPPSWVTPELWGAVSIVDRGPAPVRLTRDRWMCLPGGNMAWRRKALIARGGFADAYPRTEDRELLVRHLLAGGQALYAPDMVAFHHLAADRLTRRSFRSWHRTEGRLRAGYAFEELLTAKGGLRSPADGTPRVLGIARHLYREWARVLGQHVRARLSRRTEDAFRSELRLLALSAYMRRRIELTATPKASLPHRASAAAARVATQAAAVLSALGE